MKGDIVKKLDTRHPDSQKMLPIWDKCDDVRDGQTSIHKKGTAYLPRLSGQTDEEYKSYVKRATFYGAFSRTVDAFQGMVMRKPAMIDGEPSALLEDVTATGLSLDEFTNELLEDALVTGFGGVLVEHSLMPKSDSPLTIAQTQLLGLRPYLCHYDAKCIINWRKVKGRFIQIVLEEKEDIKTSEFESESVERFLVLDLDESGFYRQRKFERSAKNPDEFVQIDSDIYPLINNSKINEIPFYFIGCADDLPPLIDLVDLNLSHYITTADLENACHFVGTPQPWVAGAQLEPGTSLSVGGTSAWVFPDPQAKAQYLEFSGQGLGALENRLMIKEKQMAALGAKMLSDTVIAETATGSSLRSNGEFSVLAQLANDIGKVLTRACSFMLQWAGQNEVTIKLNTDYLPNQMQPQELQALLQAWQTGAISFASLYGNLKAGEIFLHGEDAEEEQAAIGDAPLTGLMP